MAVPLEPCQYRNRGSLFDAAGDGSAESYHLAGPEERLEEQIHRPPTRQSDVPRYVGIQRVPDKGRAAVLQGGQRLSNDIRFDAPAADRSHRPPAGHHQHLGVAGHGQRPPLPGHSGQRRRSTSLHEAGGFGPQLSVFLHALRTSGAAYPNQFTTNARCL